MIRKYLEQALISADIEDIKRNVLRAYEIILSDGNKNPSVQGWDNVRREYEQNGIIAAIKLRRQITGEGLKEAKDFVDRESRAWVKP